MAVKIKLLPSGHTFSAQGRETVLEAALRAGLAPNYGCSSGNCGLCRARVVSGEVERVRHTDYAFSEAERTAGYVLLCACTGKSDLVLEAGEAERPEDLPLQRIAARVRRVEPLGERVTVLHVQTPRTQRLRFLAGQTVRLGLGGLTPREIAIASCPCDDRNLQFHFERRAGDELAEYVHAGPKSGEAASVEGPIGHFVLPVAIDHPLLFLAYGAGFAPIKSLIEHLIASEEGHAMRLYWLAPAGGHYLDNLARSWSDALDAFRYVPLTASLDSLEESLRTLHAENPDVQACEIFAAGPLEFLRLARERLAPDERWHEQEMPG